MELSEIKTCTSLSIEIRAEGASLYGSDADPDPVRKDPHHFAGSGSAPKPMDPDPDPTLFHTRLRKDVLQMN